MNKKLFLLIISSFILISTIPMIYSISEIKTTNAEHLGEDRTFISDIYEEIYQLDDVWSEPINNNEYVRITFETNLSSDKDITIFPRIVSGNPKIEIYEKDGNEKIAEFSSITSNEYNKIYLTNLIGEQDVFDLKVVKGSVEFDYIVDPIVFVNVSSGTTAATENGMAWNHAIDCSLENTVLIVGIGMDHPGGYTVASVTYNLTALSLTDAVQDADGDSRVEMWNLTSPACGGNYEIAVTWSAGGDADEAAGVSSVYSNVGSIDLSSKQECSTNNRDAISCPINVPIAADSFGVDVCAIDDINDLAINGGENQVERITSDEGAVMVGISDATTGDGTVTMDWTWGTDEASHVGVEITYLAPAPDEVDPYFTSPPVSGSIDYGALLGVDFDADDAGGFDTFWVNNTDYFTINDTGWLTNSSWLPGGTYAVNVSINDTAGNSNFTVYVLTVNPISPGLGFAITPSSTQDYLVETTATGSGCPAGLTCNLYRESIGVSNEEAVTLGVGTYNYTYNFTGNVNYTSGSASDDLTVNKIAAPASLTTNETWTEDYGVPITIGLSESNAGDGDVTYVVHRDSIAKGTGENVTLAGGGYDYILNTTGGDNYSASASLDSETLTVSAIAAQTSLVFDVDSPQDFDVEVTPTCGVTTGEGSAVLNLNGSVITSGDPYSLGVEGWLYNCSLVATANYTYYENTSVYAVSQIASVVNLTLNQTQSNTTMFQGDSIYLNCSTLTGDSGEDIEMYREDSLINKGTSPISNLTTFSAAQVENITCLYLNSQNYTVSVETWFVNVTEVPDNVAPYFTDIPEDASIDYRVLLGVEFDADDVIGLDKFWVNNTDYFTINGTGWLSNSSWLPGGTYAINVSINDTSGNTNETVYIVTVNPIDPGLGFAITPTNTQDYLVTTTATGSGCPAGLTCNLYRESIGVSNEEAVTLGVGTYNYTYNFTGNVNYTSGSASDDLTVNKIAAPASLTTNETWTEDYGVPITIGLSESNAGDGDVTYVVHRDSIAKGTGENVTLAGGTYDYVLNTTGGDNYSASASLDSETLTVEPIAAQTSLSFDVDSPQDFGVEVTPTCGVTTGEGSAVLNLNTSTISSGDPYSLGVGAWLYNCSLVATANYTYYENTSIYAVSQIASVVNLTLNQTQSNTTMFQGDSIYLNCSTLTGDSGEDIEMYREDSLINKGTSPISNLTTFSAAQVENITCLYLNSQNYTVSVETWFVNVTEVLDEEAPIVTIVSPVAQNYSQSTMQFNLTATDNIGVDSCWYTLDLGINNVSMDQGVGSDFGRINNSIGDDTYIVNFYCNDTSNNINNTESVTFTIDTTPPKINLISPLNQTYALSSIDFNISANENLNYCLVSIDNWGSNSTMSLNASLTGAGYTNSSINDGGYTARFWCNDTLGNINNTESVGFTIDTVNPVVNIVFPTDNQFLNYNESVGLNYSIATDDSDSCWYSLDGAANQTIASCINTTLNLSEGNHLIELWVNDSANLKGSDSVNFTIDLTKPTVTLVNPINDTQNTTTNTIDFYYNVSDTNSITNCSLIINDIINTTITSPEKDQTNNITIPLSNGDYNWGVNCTDIANNINLSETRTLGVNYSIIVDDSGFDGDSTNFPNVVNNSDVNNITNLTLEKTESGKISFLENVDLSLNVENSVLNLSKYVNISFNRIEVNSTALTGLNANARLKLYNLTFTNPQALKDGAVCSDCTEVSYLGNTFIFDVTGFSVYSSRETPTIPTGDSGGDTGGGGGGGGGITYECSKDSDCSEGYSCYEHKCVKLFDVEILNISALIETLSFKLDYRIMGMAEINSDVIIEFWIEDSGEKVPLGQDTIFLGNFEEKIKSTTLNLPYNVPDGSYNLYVQSSYENYAAKSFRKINIGIPEKVRIEEKIRIETLKEDNFFLWILIAFLVLIVILFIIRRTRIFILGGIIYLKKKIFSSKMDISFKEEEEEEEEEVKDLKDSLAEQEKPAKISPPQGKIFRIGEMSGGKVFTTSGNYVGIIEGAIVSRKRVSGWIIAPDKKYHLNKSIFIKHKHISDIKDVFLINENIEQHLFLRRSHSFREKLGILKNKIKTKYKLSSQAKLVPNNNPLPSEKPKENKSEDNPTFYNGGEEEDDNELTFDIEDVEEDDNELTFDIEDVEGGDAFYGKKSEKGVAKKKGVVKGEKIDDLYGEKLKKDGGEDHPTFYEKKKNDEDKHEEGLYP